MCGHVDDLDVVHFQDLLVVIDDPRRWKELLSPFFRSLWQPVAEYDHVQSHRPIGPQVILGDTAGSDQANPRVIVAGTRWQVRQVRRRDLISGTDLA